MTVPMKLKRRNKEYILEKIYPSYALYKDINYGVKECFTFHELGLIEEMIEPPRSDLNAEKVKI